MVAKINQIESVLLSLSAWGCLYNSLYEWFQHRLKSHWYTHMPMLFQQQISVADIERVHCWKKP